MTECSLCKKDMRGTVVGGKDADFCVCFDKKEDNSGEENKREELWAFNEGHRNELFEFLAKEKKEVRLTWLKWWMYYLKVRIKYENDPCNMNVVQENIDKSIARGEKRYSRDMTYPLLDFDDEKTGEKEDER